MSTVAVTLKTQLTVVETFTAAELTTLPAAARILSNNDFDMLTSLSASSTPAATKWHGKAYTGTQNLDLTSLTNEIGGAVTLSGLKVHAIMCNNLSTTDPLTISDAAANPYSLNGTSDIDIPALGRLLMYFGADELADVSGSALGIDITPATGESFELILVAG